MILSKIVDRLTCFNRDCRPIKRELKLQNKGRAYFGLMHGSSLSSKKQPLGPHSPSLLVSAIQSLAMKYFPRLPSCLQVKASVRVEYGQRSGFVYVGAATASDQNWTDLKGAFTLDEVPSRAHLYFEGPAGGVDILLDRVELAPADVTRHCRQVSGLFFPSATSVNCCC